MKRWYRVLCLFLSLPMMAHAGIPQSDNTTLGTPEQRMQWEAELQPTPEAVEEIAGLSLEQKSILLKQITSEVYEGTFSDQNYQLVLAASALDNDYPIDPSIYLARVILARVYETWRDKSARFHYQHEYLSSLRDKAKVYSQDVAFPLVIITIILEGQKEAVIPAKKTVGEQQQSHRNRHVDVTNDLNDAEKSLVLLQETIDGGIVEFCHTMQQSKRDYPEIFSKAIDDFKMPEVYDGVIKLYGSGYNYDLVMNRCFNE